MSWVIFTILATILQSFRNLEQKSLNKRLDALTVSWSRFIIPLPFAIIVVILTFYQFDNKFIFYCFVAGLFQIAGNVFLLQTFPSTLAKKSSNEVNFPFLIRVAVIEATTPSPTFLTAANPNRISTPRGV